MVGASHFAAAFVFKLAADPANTMSSASLASSVKLPEADGATKEQTSMREVRATAAIVVGATLVVCAAIGDAGAAATRLDCVLTDTATQPGSERRPLVVVFDEDNKTVAATEGDRSYNFTKVTITYLSISGQGDDVSLGIDRSSLGIVWQRYDADKVRTEFGRCQVARAPT